MLIEGGANVTWDAPESQPRLQTQVIWSAETAIKLVSSACSKTVTAHADAVFVFEVEERVAWRYGTRASAKVTTELCFAEYARRQRIVHTCIATAVNDCVPSATR